MKLKLYNILYLLPNYNINGGTPKKTLDVVRKSNNNCFLYVWSNDYDEFKYLFENSKANLYEGPFGRNIFKHLSYLLKIIDKHNIQLVQTQFSFGELLGYLVKYFRPKLKVIVAFVGPLSPSGIKKIIANQIYKNTDAFVFVSNYVKKEKMISFPLLKNKYSKLIYNGTDIRESEKCSYQKPEGEILILAVSGLIKVKNIQVLIKCLEILQKKVTSKVKFRVAGDGPLHDHLKEQIKERNLESYFDLIGYDDNIGGLLTQTDIFVHPCYEEGFGIAVAEAMIAEKPIVVANAGALPELIENEKTGLIVDPFNAEEWADAIIRLVEDKRLASELGFNAMKKASAEFSVEKFVSNYEQLYDHLLNK